MAPVYDVGNVTLSFLKIKIKIKIKRTRVDSKFRVETELLHLAAPHEKKMEKERGGGTQFSFFYSISPSLLIASSLHSSHLQDRFSEFGKGMADNEIVLTNLERRWRTMTLSV